MRLHRFYIPEKIDGQKEVSVQSEELLNQLSKVFRLKIGDPVILFDGSGNDYECTIFGLNKSDQNLVIFKVEKSSPSRFTSDKKVTLCVSIVKKDTFEWIVEKATELGVTKIIPIVSERSEKKNLNEERLKKIAIEASEQSGRGDVPVIHPIITLKEAIDYVAQYRGPTSLISLAFHLEGESFRSLTQDRPTQAQLRGTTLELFFGPEGGWSDAELDLFHKNKIPIISLGKQVLRAETAVVSALSLTILGK